MIVVGCLFEFLLHKFGKAYKMSEQQPPVESETFEIALRILGNEIFAMQISSKSAKKNWVVIGLISVVLLATLANQISPILIALFN